MCGGGGGIYGGVYVGVCMWCAGIWMCGCACVDAVCDTSISVYKELHTRMEIVSSHVS